MRETVIRNEILFSGEPEVLRKIKQELASQDGNTPIVFNRIIPADSSERIALWGTAAEPDEQDVVLYRNDKFLSYTFDTGETPPTKIYEALARSYPEPSMTVEYASDDYGNDCGKFVSESGSTALNPCAIDDSIEFACELWNLDPEEVRGELAINFMEE